MLTWHERDINAYFSWGFTGDVTEEASLRLDFIHTISWTTCSASLVPPGGSSSALAGVYSAAEYCVVWARSSHGYLVDTRLVLPVVSTCWPLHSSLTSCLTNSPWRLFITDSEQLGIQKKKNLVSVSDDIGSRGLKKSSKLNFHFQSQTAVK